MKIILIALIVLLTLLQYEFWFSDGGIKTVWQLEKNIEKQQKINQDLDQRNEILVAEIKDLRSGNEAIEAHARNDLGMIKNNETFYQIVPAHKRSK